jgi:hypothetical protein
MDCSACRQLAAFRRSGGPAELAPEDVAALDRHLAGCPACAALLVRQDVFDGSVSRAMRAVPVPAGLRDRLLADALARRGAEWRQSLGKGATALGIAVVGLVVCWSGYLNFLRPAFDTVAVSDQFAAASETPEAAEADVRGWLAREGLPPDLPPALDFDYRYHQFHGYEEIDGRKVPVVLFAQPGTGRLDTARVYVVRSGQFDQYELQATQNSFCSVKVFQDGSSAIAYVVLYTSATLDSFLKPKAILTPG